MNDTGPLPPSRIVTRRSHEAKQTSVLFCTLFMARGRIFYGTVLLFCPLREGGPDGDLGQFPMHRQ